jgi:hypothetical protein
VIFVEYNLNQPFLNLDPAGNVCSWLFIEPAIRIDDRLAKFGNSQPKMNDTSYSVSMICLEVKQNCQKSVVVPLY